MIRRTPAGDGSGHPSLRPVRRACPSASDEESAAGAQQADPVHGDEQQRDPADGRAMAVDLDAAREVAVDVALAVTLRAGSVAARLARATVVRPVTATAAGVLQFAGLVMPDGPRHPLVADLTVRGEGARAELEHAGMEALRRILRRAVETALSVIDLTELVHTHV